MKYIRKCEIWNSGILWKYIYIGLLHWHNKATATEQSGFKINKLGAEMAVKITTNIPSVKLCEVQRDVSVRTGVFFIEFPNTGQ